MGSHVFLSDEWIAAAEALYEEFAGRLEAPDETVRLNVVVTDTPFDESRLLGHIDNTDGSFVPRRGHIDEPEATITVPYSVARALFVEQDFELVMMSFMTGEIEIEGDVTRLLYLQDLEPTPEQAALAAEVATRLIALTA